MSEGAVVGFKGTELSWVRALGTLGEQLIDTVYDLVLKFESVPFFPPLVVRGVLRKCSHVVLSQGDAGNRVAFQLSLSLVWNFLLVLSRHVHRPCPQAHTMVIRTSHSWPITLTCICRKLVRSLRDSLNTDLVHPSIPLGALVFRVPWTWIHIWRSTRLQGLVIHIYL